MWPAMTRLGRVALVVMFSVLSAVTGCSRREDGGRPGGALPSASSSDPVRRLAMAWTLRDTATYREIFTEDYRFSFAPGDTSCRTLGACELTREQELDAARRLFTGSAPGGLRIEWVHCSLDGDSYPILDRRSGLTSTYAAFWVRVGMTLRVVTDEGVYVSAGFGYFLLALGDSARVPAGLRTGRDGNRRFIARWEDATGSGYVPPGARFRIRRGQVVRVVPWGALKARALRQGATPAGMGAHDPPR